MTIEQRLKEIEERESKATAAHWGAGEYYRTKKPPMKTHTVINGTIRTSTLLLSRAFAGDQIIITTSHPFGITPRALVVALLEITTDAEHAEMLATMQSLTHPGPR